MRRPPRPHPIPKMLEVPDVASIEVLCERRRSDSCAAALTVDDADGDRYLVIRQFVESDGEWRMAGGSEGIDRPVVNEHDPYLGVYAYANGRFFAAGRVHSRTGDVARVRLVWPDGYVLEEAVEHGIALLFGERESLDPATVEFIDEARSMIGQHSAFIDER